MLGLSELCYIKEIDLLLVTLTSDSTDNSYDDRAIGNSYHGWITNASAGLHRQEISIDGVLSLADVDQVFKNEKIEKLKVFVPSLWIKTI